MSSFSIALRAILFIALLSTSFCAEIGPDPSQVTIRSYRTPDLKAVYAPVVPESQTRSCDEELSASGGGSTLFVPFIGFFFSTYADWCNLPVRIRVLDLLRAKDKPLAHVLFAEVQTAPYRGDHVLYETCRPQRLYVEVCYRPSKFEKVVCAMSEIHKFNEIKILQPALKFRPPFLLELAPGDTAKITTEIETNLDPNRFYSRQNSQFLIRIIARARSGRNITVGALKEQSTAVLHISKLDTTKWWRRRLFNGASTFIHYSSKECPRKFASLGPRFSTMIKVSNDVKPLIKQDVRLPEFEQPEFTPAKNGDDATAEVKATNPGGGMRAGGVPTDLKYQWYLADLLHDADIVPVPIAGATDSKLTLRNYICEERLCGFGCSSASGLQRYYVEVCNTFGCKRSDILQPRFINRNGDIVPFARCHREDLL